MTSDPVPRELPPSGGFSLPHVSCVRAARFFLAQLEAAEARVPELAAELRPTHGEIAEAAARYRLEHQSLSEAVQIFAAMAAESAVNLYGVLALGEPKFIKVFERLSIKEKVERVLSWGREAPIAPDDEVREISRRLADARNEFVHPKPQEMSWNQLASTPRRKSARSDLASAQRALADALRLLTLLRTRDRDYYSFFEVF